MTDSIKKKNGRVNTLLTLDSPLSQLFRAHYGAEWNRLTFVEACELIGMGKWRVQFSNYMHLGTRLGKGKDMVDISNPMKILAALGLQHDVYALGWLMHLVATNEALSPAPKVTPLSVSNGK
jgi:hypothetical protein